MSTDQILTAAVPVVAFSLFLFFFHRIHRRMRTRRVVVAAAATDLESVPPTPQEVEIMQGALKINVDVDKCPRCGEAHEDLEFTRFVRNPIGGFTHHGDCPKEGSPILIRVAVLDDAGDPATTLKACSRQPACGPKAA